MLVRRARRRAARILSWLVFVFAIVAGSREAAAYPWMIRHTYQGCVPCHADPSGAGLLTEYGRAMGENVLRTRYGSPPSDEPPVYARPFFGLPTPDWLLVGASLRGGIQELKQPGSAWNTQYLLMEADLKAQVTFSRFRAYGSLGYLHNNGQTTQITDRSLDNLVSREHWVGVDLGDDKQFLLRAGRIDLPFGIRFDEHDLLVRNTQTTRTNINESQQDGVALSYSGEIVRGEIMAILGNYQINPDIVRERGYTGFVELKVGERAAFGLSSLVTYAGEDYLYKTPHTIRQVHGLFTRVVPQWEPLVILAEVDALVTTSDAPGNGSSTTSPGMVGALQFDLEPTQGVHAVVTGETLVQNNMPGGGSGLTKIYGGWFGALWFFAPHADVRFDCVVESMNGAASIYLLPQLHVYL
jgi:hypothetical protein